LEEQITRPVNKEISSMLLETCIRNLMDDNLDDIRSRQLQRRIERNQLREDILGKSAEYEGDSM
jgi:recombinational DNA repair protein RecR